MIINLRYRITNYIVFSQCQLLHIKWILNCKWILVVYVCVYVTCMNIAPVHTIVFISLLLFIPLILFVIVITYTLQHYVSMYYCKHLTSSQQYHYGFGSVHVMSSEWTNIIILLISCHFMDKMYTFYINFIVQQYRYFCSKHQKH